MDGLIERYRRNYGIPESEPLTEEQVRFHLDLERRLTAELRASSPGDRAKTFEHAYGELYSRMPWLHTASPERDPHAWVARLGKPPRRIYEVGSGQGGLARALVRLGYSVDATEITTIRGGTREEGPGLRWMGTDGIHLERYAAPGSYDAVLSNQVIEHLHPDDIVDHFRGAYAILRPGGRYVFATPHRFRGPTDISRVFGFDEPIGMHLREWTYRELAIRLRRAGFQKIQVPFGVPDRIPAPDWLRGRPSTGYLAWVVAVERLLGPLRRRRQKLVTSRLLRNPLFPRELTMIAIKG